MSRVDRSAVARSRIQAPSVRSAYAPLICRTGRKRGFFIFVFRHVTSGVVRCGLTTPAHTREPLTSSRPAALIRRRHENGVNTFVFFHKDNGDLGEIYEKWVGSPLPNLPIF